MSRQPPSWPTLFLSAFLALLTYGLLKLYLHRRFYKNLPGPPHSFLWGHINILGTAMSALPEGAHPQQGFTAIAQKYNLPGAFYLDLWPVGPSQLLVTDPDLAHQFMVVKNHPKNTTMVKIVDQVLGAGNIVSAEGKEWKAAHNMLAPAFSAGRQRDMAGMMAEEVMVFRGIMKAKAKTGETFKMEHVLLNCVMNTVGRAIFDESLELQTTKKENPMIRTYLQVCEESLVIMYSWNPVARFSARRNIDRLSKELEAQLGEMIRVRFEKVQRENIDVSQKRRLCIVDLILRERLLEVRKTQEEALDPRFIYSAVTQIRTLLLAASGTTSSTLCYAFMLLSNRPDIVQRLRNEHDKVFCPGIDATYSLLQNEPNRLNDLSFTTDFIKEVLRLYPIGNSSRGADATGFITYNGRQLPTGGHVLSAAAHTIHYDSQLFPQASKFDPDRWTRDNIPRNAWRPFESGPRSCLGQTMAMEEMKVTLLLTMRDFDFQCAGVKPTAPRTSWTEMDAEFGDLAFQKITFEAKPMEAMPMTVRMAAAA